MTHLKGEVFIPKVLILNITRLAVELYFWASCFGIWEFRTNFQIMQEYLKNFWSNSGIQEYGWANLEFFKNDFTLFISSIKKSSNGTIKKHYKGLNWSKPQVCNSIYKTINSLAILCSNTPPIVLESEIFEIQNHTIWCMCCDL